MTLFIQSFLTGDFVSLRFKLAIVGIMWLIVAIAIIIDLFSGVRKAKERGEMRTSVGFRQTVTKVVQYYAFLAFAFLFDCMLMLILSAFGVEEVRVLPFSSIAACCFLVFIEWKSFMEKANDKYKKQFNRSVSDLATLLENREDLLHGLVEIIKKQTEKQKQNNDEEDK
ncbi:phage holin family protein [Dysgonomonas sp. ZJ709]|uniref:phage holin family protein n=1 Tax=Dysgonomonas sp. ZJ709 TaxID=2709797 RepID=UPI0013EDFCC8|nr:phage holin family protein [Dysgonomonas sp. ZJ709]